MKYRRYLVLIVVLAVLVVGACAKKKPPVPANDSGETPKPARKKAAPKRKAKAVAPPRTGTDG